MPDIQNYSVVVGANQSVTIPRLTISGKIVDSSSGAVLHDFTGANAAVFPAILATLTAQQQLDVVELIVLYILKVKGFV